MTESRREEMQFLRRRSCSVLEHKEHAQGRLEEELQRAQEVRLNVEVKSYGEYSRTKLWHSTSGR